MNKFTVVFLILFLITMMTVGLMALNERLNLTGQAEEKKCPAQEFPKPDSCPGSTQPVLEKNAKGCFVFVCK